MEQARQTALAIGDTPEIMDDMVTVSIDSQTYRIPVTLWEASPAVSGFRD